MIQSCSWPELSEIKNLFHFSKPALLMLLFLSFLGCTTVDPDYTPPENRAPTAWHTELGPGLTIKTADPQHSVNWWTNFNDPVLNTLIEQAVKNNINLNQAMAKVRETRARSHISWAKQSPILDANAATTNFNSNEDSGGSATRSAYSIGFDAGWEIDIFGGLQRSIEASEADYSAQRETLRDVLVTLSAEVGRNYLDLRTTQARLDVAEKNLAIQQQTYDLNLAKYQAGLSSELPLQQARYNLENTGSRIPALRISLEEIKNR
ncbi:MAG: TolC family protein, partial [Desulfobulbaceae bacterium]|nr:TolC family protein [Desulfobulbaceae bacterium]